MLVLTPKIKAFARAEFRSAIVAPVIGQEFVFANGACNGLSAAIPCGVFCPFEMAFRVVASVCQFKVFNTVISLVLVFVVNQFGRDQGAPKVSAHYESMLGNISGVPAPQSVRMFRHEQINVPIGGNKTAAQPFRVSLSFAPVASDIAYTIPISDSIKGRLAWGKSASATAPTINRFGHVNNVIKTIEKGPKNG